MDKNEARTPGLPQTLFGFPVVDEEPAAQARPVPVPGDLTHYIRRAADEDCVVAGCSLAAAAWVSGPPGSALTATPLCRDHLAQMLQDTGLIAKPEYRALLDEMA